MANYLVTDTDLTSVADAIRTKGGTSAALEFPDGFVDAIDDIETGGGGDTLAEYGNGTLATWHTTDLTSIISNGMRYNSNLKTIVAPNLTSIGTNAFGNAGLKTLDTAKLSSIANGAFVSCASFTKLILRRSSVASLGNTSAFNSSPFASSGSGGTLYVPSAMIASYQSATNWSTILGYANNSIQAIEGSIYETEYADGTPIS